jgi:hypothetical protein
VSGAVAPLCGISKRAGDQLLQACGRERQSAGGQRDLTVHNIYCGYWYVGRPTLDELRMDLRAMMKKVRSDFDPQAKRD